jgi:hypothetical protein
VALIYLEELVPCFGKEMPFMDTGPSLSKKEAVDLCLGEKIALPIPADLHAREFTPRLQSSDYFRMGGRVVDRARLESVFTFIGNEGSNPSPSGLTSFRRVKFSIGRDENFSSTAMPRLAAFQRNLQSLGIHALIVYIAQNGSYSP